MDTRTLNDLTVAAQGLGCMGMSEFYGTGDQAEAERTIHRALEIGRASCRERVCDSV